MGVLDFFEGPQGPQCWISWSDFNYKNVAMVSGFQNFNSELQNSNVITIILSFEWAEVGFFFLKTRFSQNFCTFLKKSVSGIFCVIKNSIKFTRSRVLITTDKSYKKSRVIKKHLFFSFFQIKIFFQRRPPFFICSLC